jgi:hypothetical protein
MGNNNAIDQERYRNGIFSCQVTPEEAKVVWESMDNPSGPKVCKHFKEKEGKNVCPQTILNWQKHGWKKGLAGKKYANRFRQIEKLMPVMLGITPTEILKEYARESGNEEIDIHESMKQARLDLAVFLRGLVSVQMTLMSKLSISDINGLASLVHATEGMAKTVFAIYEKFSDEESRTIHIVKNPKDGDELKDALSAWGKASKKQ